uniref:Neurotransmitter-gated ion-channel ligand-binding domain-containing protein n=1 Tax=Panagrolaimus sp. ES5 TaxID=591445 RepID=A0AC34FUR7_9BILA
MFYFVLGSAVEELFNALKVKAASSKIPNSTSTKTTAVIKPQKVAITLSYPKVIAVDDRAQTITTTFELRLEWIDPTLSWNPSQYHGLDHILFPADLIFIPDVSLTNSAKLNLPSLSANRYVK